MKGIETDNKRKFEHCLKIACFGAGIPKTSGISKNLKSLRHAKEKSYISLNDKSLVTAHSVRCFDFFHERAVRTVCDYYTNAYSVPLIAE